MKQEVLGRSEGGIFSEKTQFFCTREGCNSSPRVCKGCSEAEGGMPLKASQGINSSS